VRTRKPTPATGRGCHARRGREAVENRLHAAESRGVIVVLRRIEADAHDEQAVGIHAERRGFGEARRADDQTRHDQRGERERDLRI
jgi:hypothetical protein